MLIRDITRLENSNFDKEFVKSRLRDSPYIPFKQVSKIFDKNLSTEESIQKAGNANNIVNLNRSNYISKDKRVNIKEEKTLNYLIHVEERIIRLLKSLEDKGEIPEKEKNDLYPSGSKPGVLYRFAKIHKVLEDGTPFFRSNSTTNRTTYL